MKLSEAEIDERVREAAGFVGVPEELFKVSFGAFGQKRRIAIAGVLAMRPDVLILDEPTAGLDPSGRESILSNVVNYHKASGATVILVTHSMEDVARLAQRLIVFHNGRVAIDAPPSQIFSRAEELRSMGLEIPKSTAIALRLRELGLPISPSVYTVEQLKNAILSLREEAKKC